MKLKLKELRKSKRLTQKELADLMGFNLGTYRNYEQGIRAPNAETLIEFAEFYDTTVDYILGRPDKDCPVRLINETSEDVFIRLINAYQNLEHENRKKVADYSEDLLHAQTFNKTK